MRGGGEGGASRPSGESGTSAVEVRHVREDLVEGSGFRVQGSGFRV